MLLLLFCLFLLLLLLLLRSLCRGEVMMLQSHRWALITFGLVNRTKWAEVRFYLGLFRISRRTKQPEKNTIGGWWLIHTTSCQPHTRQ